MSSEQQGLRAGHVIALLGALAAFASLWRPWYAVDLPPQLRDVLAGEGARAAAGGSSLGAFAQAMANMLPGSIDVSGWDAMEAGDVILCVIGVAVAALVVAAAGAFGSAVRVDATAAAGLISAVGVAGVLVVARQAVFRPGGDAVQRVGFDVHLGQGLWIALAGCAAMAIGGAFARSAPKASSPAPVATWTFDEPAAPVEDHTLTSVAPPGAR